MRDEHGGERHRAGQVQPLSQVVLQALAMSVGFFGALIPLATTLSAVRSLPPVWQLSYGVGIYALATGGAVLLVAWRPSASLVHLARAAFVTCVFFLGTMFSDIAVSTTVVRLTKLTSQLHDPLSLVFLWVIVFPFWFAPLGWLQFRLRARQHGRQG